MKKKYRLPPDTVIEMVAIKGREVWKKEIKVREIPFIPRKKGWKYHFYQLGFCSIKENRDGV